MLNSMLYNSCRVLMNLKNGSPLFRKELLNCTKFRTNLYVLYLSNYQRFYNTITLKSINHKTILFKQSTCYQQIRPQTSKTNVKNNVILYKDELVTKSHNRYMFYGLLQMIPWFGIAYVEYLIFFTGPPAVVSSWTDYFKEVGLPLIVFWMAACAGPSIFLAVYFKTLRSVKYIILKSGGKEVTIVTYHPFKKENLFTVPVEKVSCKLGRAEMINFMPMKVEGKLLHFILDKQGQFLNPELFDYTVGQNRKLK